jgi:hypothetical protein
MEEGEPLPGLALAISVLGGAVAAALLLALGFTAFTGNPSGLLRLCLFFESFAIPLATILGLPLAWAILRHARGWAGWTATGGAAGAAGTLGLLLLLGLEILKSEASSIGAILTALGAATGAVAGLIARGIAGRWLRSAP